MGLILYVILLHSCSIPTMLVLPRTWKLLDGDVLLAILGPF